MADTITPQDLEALLDEFSVKIIHHIDQQIDDLKSNISGIDRKYEHLVATLDTFLKRLDDTEVNDQARDAQVARLERWIEQIAAKTGVKLEY